jgi:hypothetical protein
LAFTLLFRRTLKRLHAGISPLVPIRAHVYEVELGGLHWLLLHQIFGQTGLRCRAVPTKFGNGLVKTDKDKFGIDRADSPAFNVRVDNIAVRVVGNIGNTLARAKRFAANFGLHRWASFASMIFCAVFQFVRLQIGQTFGAFVLRGNHE